MHMRRRVTVPLALAGLFVILGIPAQAAGGPQAAQSMKGMAPMPAPSQAATAIRQDMRKLWSDHVIWTRDYIVAAVAGTADQQAAAARLLKNQDDIGAAIAAYYGKPGGDRLTALLKEHITIAVDLIKAAKAKDDATYKSTDQRWQRNGDEIATFLSGANPNWPKATLSDMMKKHLSTTTNE